MTRILAAALACLLPAIAGAGSLANEGKCQQSLSVAAGAYLRCMQAAMGSFYIDGREPFFTQPLFGKCVNRYAGAWQKISTKLAGRGTTCQGQRYVDNGNGTFDDRLTRLTWEKKTGQPGEWFDCTLPQQCSDPHGVNNRYVWSTLDTSNTNGPWRGDGTAFADFVNRLNYENGGFAGASDWRLPSLYELYTLVEPGFPNCSTGPCTKAPGPAGPLAAPSYWSSSTDQSSPPTAWLVDFSAGGVFSIAKFGGGSVRAVRGGR